MPREEPLGTTVLENPDHSTESNLESIWDEEWQKQLLDHKEPPGNVWMNDIRVNVEKPKTAPNFNLY